LLQLLCWFENYFLSTIAAARPKAKATMSVMAKINKKNAFIVVDFCWLKNAAGRGC
jgi:hypothetical protein